MLNLKHRVLIIYIITVLNYLIPRISPSVIIPTPSPIVGHNVQCNSTIVCNPQSLLTCTAGSCQCESPSNQKYDHNLRRCVSGVGGQCTVNVSREVLSANSASTPIRLCIENSVCAAVTEGNYTECQCLENYIENSEGMCVPGIGQPCNYRIDECNPLAMVVCKNGRCECLDKLQIFDSEMKRCVSPVGTHCKFDSLQLGCVKNALCYPFYYWIPPKCICKPGYVMTINRTCVADILHDPAEI